MKLYYFKDPHGNFGDDLNPWLWNKLLPNFFDDDASQIFVGIGTLLNHRLPVDPIKHVFGSGYGYGEVPTLNDRFVFHAVRGYETARMLGLDPELAITDAAVLLRSVELPRAEQTTHRAGFIPHCQSSRYFDWESLCSELGLKYISAEWDVEKVLVEMSKCEMLVCEAMHGAIAADTLRIPWIPVSCYDYISEFKWRDWLSTLELPYSPYTITSLYNIERDHPLPSRLKNKIKRGLRSTGFWSENWTRPPRPPTGAAEYERALNELKAAAHGPSFLSRESTLNGHIERYLELIEKIRRPG